MVSYIWSFPGVLTFVRLYIIVAEVLVMFIDDDAKIKGEQLGVHEIKQKILSMTPPFFLRGITCLTRIQVILKL